MERPFARLLFVVATLLAARRASADPRIALDRLEPSERGSEWFANESLDLRGHVRPSVGYSLSYTKDPAPSVEHSALILFEGGVVLFDRARVSLGFPLQLHASGEAAAEHPAPRRAEGVGDLRVSADARVFGDKTSAVRGAAGVQVWAPTGQQSQWTSDGAFRARPRAMIAGDAGALTWAAQIGVHLRRTSEASTSAAVGARIAQKLVVGPEIFASTPIEDPLAKSGTPVEVLLGAHWIIDGGGVGLAAGRGLTDALGSPSFRAFLSIDWAPAIEPAKKPRRPKRDGAGGAAGAPDADGDGIPDAIDACPKIVGLPTSDPSTNGCPPDADGDRIDDIRDACPTLPGIATDDPATNGCPDRDRDHDGVPNDVDVCPDDPGPSDVDPKRSGCPKAFVRDARIVVLDPIAFKPNMAELATTPEAEAVLTAVLAAALKVPEARRLRVEGHTDDRGDKRLGAARAEAVVKWLGDHGIDRARMTAVGVGPDRPIATNQTEVGRAENRRIEIHLEP
jgi:outer membrane protein OmpA-like peptidoglycan-associated protein